MARTVTPGSAADAAAALAAAAAEQQPVRIRGAGTKLDWGAQGRTPGLWLSSAGLDQVTEHNIGDFTAVVEAGVPLTRLQETLANAGQMLAIDPPLGRDGAEATLGGVISTADSGPLRHRYGAPRDLVLGMTVALSDGTVARSGGKVIKNVAGYDLAKLFTGAFGTLGMVVSISVRLHPLPQATATALGASSDPGALGRAALALAAAPLELDSLDVAWRGARGGLLACCAGAEAGRRAQRVAALMRSTGLEGVEVVEDDAPLWARQRTGQRSARGLLVRVATRPSQLPAVIAATVSAGGTLVGRAGLGIGYVELEPESLAALRAALPPGARLVVQDAPQPINQADETWGEPSSAALGLMQRIKAGFDPSGVCNPGIYAGGI